VLIALRMKGEEAAELAGFLDALEPELQRVPAVAPGWVVLPSYNGARAAANLLPLLALLLARAGIPVLVHGQASEPQRPGVAARVTSADIFAALGVPGCATPAEAPARAAAGWPALMDLAALSPALARLVALRPQMGVRNVAHTLAKLIVPVQGPSLLVSSYTHPVFGELQAELFRTAGTHAMSLRGTDGEAVMGARRAPRLDYWFAGTCTVVSEAQDVAQAGLQLPAPDAAATAAWTRAVLAGALPAPSALERQVQLIAAALRFPGAVHPGAAQHA